MRRRRNPGPRTALIVVAIIGAGVVGALVYEHNASAAPAKPGTKPGQPPAIPPAGDRPVPGPQPLTADGHKTVSATSLIDEASWAVIDLAMEGTRLQTILPEASSNPGFTSAFVVTNVPGADDITDPGYMGYASAWLAQMFATGRRVFVAPDFFVNTGSTRARFAALDSAPAAYLEVIAA